MFVSVDIKCICNHISLLKKEQKEAKLFEEYLVMWRRQVSMDQIKDIEFIAKRLNVVHNEVSNIQRRISLLESIVEVFGETKLVISQLLSDAQDAVSQYY